MKKRILSALIVLTMVVTSCFLFAASASAQNLSEAKQLYHLAIENQLFGSYDWGGSGVAFPDNSMAASYGWPSKTKAELYNGGGWNASGNVVRVRNYAYIQSLGDIYMDATTILGGRGESNSARKVQLWKINSITNNNDDNQVKTAMGVQANWEKAAEVTVNPDKNTALTTGKGFNWADLATPVLVKPGEVYIIVVEQGAGAVPGSSWGNPRVNDFNNVLAVHPDNIANDTDPQIANDSDFYISGAPIGTFGGNLVDVQNALAGNMYCGGNFKYAVVSPDTGAAPAASSVTKTTATITWEAASNSPAFGNVDGYSLDISENDGAPSVEYINGANTVSFNFTNLKPNTKYTIVVKALTTDDETGSIIAIYSPVTFTTEQDTTSSSNNNSSNTNTSSESNNSPNTNDNVSVYIVAVMLALTALTIAIRKKLVQ